nr:reverse transcriptase domain-containing protein [Tanacetum cinerariifolium]
MVKKGIVLGHKISKNGLEVDRSKVDVIAKLPYPMLVKGVRSFLGHAGFYQRFIQDFSKIARPMTHLLEKDTPFVFSKYFIDAFETLKKKFTEAPILVVPDWNLPFELMCDASDFAIDHSALKYLLSKQDAKPRLIWWVRKGQRILRQITCPDLRILIKMCLKIKGILLSKGCHLNKRRNSLRRLNITSGTIPTFFGYVRIKSFEGVCMAKNLMISSKLVMKDPSGAIMVPISTPRKTPRAIISDCGTHFCNDKFAKVMSKYRVTHRLATAYHPQTSGQVEVSNRGLKRILERKVGENYVSWFKKLDDALWDFRNAYKTPIGCTPYKLVYGKSCHLPIELEHKAYWALKHLNFHLKTMGDHRKLQLNELNELRDQAYVNYLIYKEKTKKLHDSKIKNRIFNVGDQVLLFNSRLKIFLGKLKTRWSGPFAITKVFPYGTVELSQLDGPNFKVNGHRVKHYFEGDVPQLAPLEDPSLPVDASPIVASLDYMADFDPIEDPEDDRADYPADGGDGDDEPYDDDDTGNEDPEEDPFEEDDEKEEEHLAPADSSAVPIIDPVLPAGDTEALEADEPTHAPGSLIRPIFPRLICRLKRGLALLFSLLDSRLGRDEIVDKMMEIAPTTIEGVNERVTKLDTTVRLRTNEFETRFRDARYDRALLRVRVNTLFKYRPDHRRTAMLIDREATYSREAWVFFMDRSLAIAAHAKTSETQVAILITQTMSPQTQLTTTLGHIKVLEARDLEPQKGPAEASNTCLSCIIYSYPL